MSNRAREQINERLLFFSPRHLNEEEEDEEDSRLIEIVSLCFDSHLKNEKMARRSELAMLS